MRICFLTPTLELHGGILVMLKYAEHLASRGHEVKILHPRSRVECRIPDGVEAVSFRIKPPPRVEFYSFNLVYAFEVMRLLRANCDVAIPIYTPLAVPSVLAKKGSGCQFRTVLLYQDFFEMPWVGRYIKFVLGRKWFTRNLDKVVAVSQGIAREFEKVSGVMPTVVPNGVDDLFFTETGPVEKGRYVLFVGRPVESKGFDVFQRAMAQVSEVVPGVKGCLVSSAVEDGRIGAIETIRYRDREQLRRLYAGALVYVHAAIGESFGLPPLEAMACGAATVVTRTVGTNDYAQDQVNCLAVDYGDHKVLAEKVIAILQDENLRRGLEQNGRRTAREYQWRRSLNRFEEEVKSAAGPRQAEFEPEEHAVAG